jgi:hypothetical protein
MKNRMLALQAAKYGNRHAKGRDLFAEIVLLRREYEKALAAPERVLEPWAKRPSRERVAPFKTPQVRLRLSLIGKLLLRADSECLLEAGRMLEKFGDILQFEKPALVVYLEVTAGKQNEIASGKLRIQDVQKLLKAKGLKVNEKTVRGYAKLAGDKFPRGFRKGARRTFDDKQDRRDAARSKREKAEQGELNRAKVAAAGE